MGRESKRALEVRAAMGAFLKRRIAELYPQLSASEAYILVGRKAGGLSLSTMQRLIGGKAWPKLYTLVDLADALGCEVGELTKPTPTHADRRRRPQQRPENGPN